MVSDLGTVLVPLGFFAMVVLLLYLWYRFRERRGIAETPQIEEMRKSIEVLQEKNAQMMEEIRGIKSILRDIEKMLKEVG